MDANAFASRLLLHSHPYLTIPFTHAHPSNQIRVIHTANPVTKIESINSMPRGKGTLHFRCTYLDCGQEFNSCDDLVTHTTTYHKITLAFRGPSPNKSENSISKMEVHDGVTKVEAQVKPSMIAVANKGGKLPKIHDWPIRKDSKMDEQEEVTVGKATMARPGLERRGTSKMDRNALANPGASNWTF